MNKHYKTQRKVKKKKKHIIKHYLRVITSSTSRGLARQKASSTSSNHTNIVWPNNYRDFYKKKKK